MPRLKTPPVNAYEILCSELARDAMVPFGAWCALDDSEVLRYASNRNFNIEPGSALKSYVEPSNKAAFVLLRDLANYLSERGEYQKRKQLQTLASNDGATGDDIGLGFKSLCDRHAISLLFLDHGTDHTSRELRNAIGDLLAQYAVLENETRLLTEKGAESIRTFTPIEKNRSFARTGAKVGQLMGYAGYAEKESELPLATSTESIPSMPKLVKQANNPQYGQYLIKQHLFNAIEKDLLLIRTTALNKNPRKTKVTWRWSFTQGNNAVTQKQERLGLIGADYDKWLASGRVLGAWFACARRNKAAAKELVNDAVIIARKIASEQVMKTSPEAGKELLAYTDALSRYWSTSGIAKPERQNMGEALAPLFAAVLYCTAYRSNISKMGFNALAIEAGLNTISPAPEPGDQDRPQGMPNTMDTEYITLSVTKVTKAGTSNGGIESRTRTYELGTCVLIGRAPNYVDRTSGEHYESGVPTADFILDDPAVSRLALVLQTKDKLVLEVLNKNTYLRSKSLDKGRAVEIEPGDVLTLNGSESFYKIEISRLD